MSDLTDRMRTCAAALANREHADPDRLLTDAADLLLEASNALAMMPEPLGEPMALLEPLPPAAAAKPATEQVGAWYGAGDALPPPREGAPTPRPNRVCPKCDSRAAKTVFRNGTELMLRCPVCATAWPYQAGLP